MAIDPSKYTNAAGSRNSRNPRVLERRPTRLPANLRKAKILRFLGGTRLRPLAAATRFAMLEVRGSS
jgi:hypothetical protein